MMQFIHNRAKGWLSWGIVVLISLAFLGWGLNDFFLAKSKRSNIAAVVDGLDIKWQEVDNTYQRMLQSYLDSDNFDISKLDTKAIKKQAQEHLVKEAALISQISKTGLQVSNNVLLDVIRHMPEFVDKEGKFSQQQYQDMLKKMGWSESHLHNYLNRQILLEQIRQGIRLSSFVLDLEADYYYDLISQTRDFGFATIPISMFKQPDASATAIKEHYEANKELYESEESVILQYLELTLNDVIKTIELSDADIEDYYKQNEALYTTPELVNVQHILISAPENSDIKKSGEARNKIEDLLNQLKLGGNFTELAKKYSEDPGSALKGGDLGWFGRNEMALEFEQAAFALSLEQPLSDIITTDYGYHVIKLIDKKPKKLLPLAEIKEKVITDFKKQQAEQIFLEKIDELSNLAFENPNSLEPAAKALNLSLKTTDKLNKVTNNSSFKDITAIPAVIEAAFNEQLLSGNNSELIKIDSEHYTVIRVATYYPKVQQTLAEVKDKINEYLKKQAAQQEAAKLAQEFVEAINNDALPSKWAEKNKLNWHMKYKISMHDTSVDKFILKEVFKIPKPDTDSVSSSKVINLPFTGDYAVISLRRVVIPKKLKDLTVIERDNFMQQLMLAKGHFEFIYFEDFIKNLAKIKLLGDL